MKELLKSRNIPDFLKDVNLDEWQARKDEIKELFLTEEYGHLPKKLVPSVTTEEQGVNFAGKGCWESVFFTFENNGKAHTVRAELILPKNKTKIPVFLYISFSGDVPNKYLPMEEILDNGFGVMMFDYQNVTSDDGDYSNGLYGLFSEDGKRCEFGKISLWAYMASACMDYLESRPEVDANSVAVAGHSRLGKTAILTSVLDNRFILTCSNNSGCCGASISRGKTEENETIEAITRVFPWWFSEKYLKYVSNEDALPFDQHMLLALIAPRYLMIGAACEDVWADNEGQLLSCKLASPIWSLYGKDGFIDTGDTSIDGEVCYHFREGSHFMSRYDWNVYMKKFKQLLGGKI